MTKKITYTVGEHNNAPEGDNGFRLALSNAISQLDSAVYKILVSLLRYTQKLCSVLSDRLLYVNDIADLTDGQLLDKIRDQIKEISSELSFLKGFVNELNNILDSLKSISSYLDNYDNNQSSETQQ